MDTQEGRAKVPEEPSSPKMETTLLLPENRIFKLTKDSTPTSGGQLITCHLERFHLDTLIKSITEKNPSYAKLPVALYSVLGNNKDQLRTLHTDWLIHYQQHNEHFASDPSDLFQLWKPKYGVPDRLKYVGASSKLEKGDENGVYIWPTPFILTEDQKQESGNTVAQDLLCFILYSNIGINGHHGSILLDCLTACISSKVVVFKTAEKEKLRGFLKAMYKDDLPALTTFVDCNQLTLSSEKTRTTVANGWNIFMKSLNESNPILKKKIDVKKLPTLESLADRLEKITSSINVPPPAAGNLLLELLAKDASPNTFKPKPPVEDKPDAPIPKLPKSPKTADPIIPENEEAFRDEFHRWLRQGIRMPPENAKALSGINMKEPGMKEVLTSVRTVINAYNVELQNMFDNYVCFEDEHTRSMVRFQQVARQREQENWMSFQNNNEPGPNSAPDIEKLRTEIRQWLCKRYLEDNDEIIKSENELARNVCKRFASAYLKKMKQVLQEKGKKIKKSELLEIHHRMCRQCINCRCLDYGGRLNNAASFVMSMLKQTLDSKFKELTENIEVSEDIPTATEYNGEMDTFQKYMVEIQNNLSFYAPDELKTLHQVTMKKVVGGPTGNAELDARLLTYLTYISEVHQEKLQAGDKGSIDNLTSLCIHLTDDRLKLLVRQTHGWEHIRFKIQDQQVAQVRGFCPAKISWIKGKLLLGYDAVMLGEKENVGPHEFHGTIFNCIEELPNRQFASEIMKAFFEHFKQLCGGISIGKTVIIIPSWFSTSNRALLRSSAAAVGLKRTFFLNESSLAAYHLSQNSGSGDAKLYCVVIARKDVVRIELFILERNPDSLEKISMVALACGDWYNQGNGSGSEMKLNPKRPPANFKQVLQQTLDRATNQIPVDKQSLPKISFVITCYPDWKMQLASFFQGNNMILMEEQPTEDFVVTAATILGSNPTEIRARLLDYAIPKTLPVVPDATSDFSAKQQGLLDKCNGMEEQLASGEVRCGVIMKKIIRETIERARLAVKTGQNTDREEEDINELIKEHTFIIQ